MKKSLSLIAGTLLASSMMIGCGSSSSGAQYYNGTFLDSGVQGVTWTCGDRSGTTGVGGLFGECRVGVPVTFTLGTINLGTIPDTSTFTDPNNTMITPTILEQASGQANVATKVAVTLQSLDSDGDPTNGITIDDATVNIVKTNYPSGVDLTESNVTVADVESNVAAIVSTIISDTNNTAMRAVDANTAKAHLEETQAAIDRGEITPVPQPGQPTGASN